MKKAINLIWQAPRFERDWIIKLLNNFQINEIIDEAHKVVMNNAIIVTQGLAIEGIEFCKYIKKFRAKNFKVGCIHLSDEWRSYPVDFYKEVDFVFRNYYRDEVQKLKNCHFFALGYKSGFSDSLVPKKISDRKYFLSFVGQLKGTRYKMFEKAKEVNGNNFFCCTNAWDDPNGLNTSEYAEVLNDSIFVLCPRGNFSLDTFRFYEALEAGAIPIVEDRNSDVIFREFLKKQLFKKWKNKSIREYCYRVYQERKYWVKIYGTNFPCPKIYDWGRLKTLISQIDIQYTNNKTQNWWIKYKQSLKDRMTMIIKNTFFQ